MAAYPSIEIDQKGSSQERVRVLQVDEWPNGSIRGRDFTAGLMWKWKLFHLERSDAEKATLATFYEANALAGDISFLSPWDGVNYANIMLTSVPKYEQSNGLWNVSIEMRMMVP